MARPNLTSHDSTLHTCSQRQSLYPFCQTCVNWSKGYYNLYCRLTCKYTKVSFFISYFIICPLVSAYWIMWLHVIDTSLFLVWKLVNNIADVCNRGYCLTLPSLVSDSSILLEDEVSFFPTFWIGAAPWLPTWSF